ncbi:MAG: MerR family transcriptional regulator [Dehalococcoidales bacterium]|nr:MerR family transcriptional regulator [Dehalococcoidales bacterium]
MEKENRPRYVISIAAEMLGTQTYTLRYYEKIGIVKPARSPGNIRLYSDYDLMLIRKVKTLMDELGVNLAGVEIILRMSRQLAELQKDKEELEKRLDNLQSSINKQGH